MEVYAKLQDGKGGDHAHFYEWATENPTDFYKIASKMIPIDLNANVAAQIGMPPITITEPRDGD